MKVFSGFIGLILILLALCFALTNRQSVNISLWPFADLVPVPLYFLSLGTLFFGLLLGGVIVWCGALAQRLEMRRLRKEIVALKEQILDFQQKIIPPYRTENDVTPKPKRRFWSFKL